VSHLERPVFREMLNFCKKNNIRAVVMYDLTRFYRAKNPLEALNLLKEVSKDVFIDFVR